MTAETDKLRAVGVLTPAEKRSLREVFEDRERSKVTNRQANMSRNEDGSYWLSGRERRWQEFLVSARPSALSPTPNTGME